jgi:putative addiction module killer protein
MLKYNVFYEVVQIETTDVFDKWFLKLKDLKAKVFIANRLRKIELDDHKGDFKNVGGNIFELRIHFGAGYRIYFTQRGNRIILLLCGGDKSTQEQDIKKARELL